MRTLIDRELYPNEMDPAANTRPRTLSVVTVLMVTAVVLSYLGAYAVPTALVNSNIMEPWPNYDDPRPRWVVMTFVGLLSSFLLMLGLFQVLGALQGRTPAVDDQD